MSLLIQFTGTSASGKTTIANRLKEFLDKEEISYIFRTPFISKKTFLHKVFGGMFLLRFLDRESVRLFFSLGAFRKSSKKFNIFEYLKIKYHIYLLEKTQKKALLYDGGGFVNLALHAVFKDLLSVEEAVEFVKKTSPSYTLIIAIETPPEKVIERGERRSGKECMGKEEKLKELYFQQKIRQNYLEKLSEHFRVCFIDGGKTIEENVDLIIREAI